MPETSFADFVTQWDRLLAGVEANAAELPHLEALRTELQSAVQEAKTLIHQQASHRAEAQQRTRDLEAVMARGKDLSTRLRSGIRSQFGYKGEKLTQFGMKPRRRPRKPEPEETPTAPPTPPPAQPAEPPTS